MSERGLILALQRFHDDPGFFGLVQQDPQSTLGLYDLDDGQREALTDAVVHGDETEIVKMAEGVGMDWKSPQVHGLGTIPDDEESTEVASPAAPAPRTDFPSENLPPQQSPSRPA